MAATATPALRGHRPALALVTTGVLGFLGITAVGGGAALIFGPGTAPGDSLQRIPLIDSWVVPGLVLGIGFGLGSLLVAYGVFRKPHWAWLGRVERRTGHHWSWIATILIGFGQLVWLALELVYLPDLSWLQALYTVVSVALLVLPMSTPVSRYLSR
jgi:hypothetical protein